MKKFKDYAKDNLRYEVPIEDVISVLGIETDNRKHIICPNPNHNDTSFGSCVINRRWNTAHCFACGKTFDNISLLQLSGRYFNESLGILADMTGHPDDFYEEDEETDEDKKESEKHIWLTKKQKDLLGIHEESFKIIDYVTTDKPKDKECEVIYDENMNAEAYVSLKRTRMTFDELPYEAQINIIKSCGTHMYAKTVEVGAYHKQLSKIAPEKEYPKKIYKACVEQLKRIKKILMPYYRSEREFVLEIINLA